LNDLTAERRAPVLNDLRVIKEFVTALLEPRQVRQGPVEN
jgi:hypothetical protein